MADSILTAWQLQKLLDYNPDTGLFACRYKPNKTKGRLATKGYRQIFVAGRRHMAHRLAWLYIYGQWPDGQIDHINRIKDDNRIVNLRAATPKQNNENRGLPSKNTSGRNGVRPSITADRWIAEIGHYGKTINLGTFASKDLAIAARLSAESRLFTHSAAVGA